MHGGKNATIFNVTKSNPAILTTSAKHSYLPGDTILLWGAGGSGGTGDIGGFGMFLNVTVSSSIVTLASHQLIAAQPVVFGGTPPGGIVNGRTYYICNNANLTTNTFQVSTTYANAQAGTAVTMTGSGSSVSVYTGLNRLAFNVGAVTDTTIVLTNCSATNFGNAANYDIQCDYSIQSKPG